MGPPNPAPSTAQIGETVGTEITSTTGPIESKLEWKDEFLGYPFVVTKLDTTAHVPKHIKVFEVHATMKVELVRNYDRYETVNLAYRGTKVVAHVVEKFATEKDADEFARINNVLHKNPNKPISGIFQYCIIKWLVDEPPNGKVYALKTIAEITLDSNGQSSGKFGNQSIKCQVIRFCSSKRAALRHYYYHAKKAETEKMVKHQILTQQLQMLQQNNGYIGESNPTASDLANLNNPQPAPSTAPLSSASNARGRSGNANRVHIPQFLNDPAYHQREIITRSVLAARTRNAVQNSNPRMDTANLVLQSSSSATFQASGTGTTQNENPQVVTSNRVPQSSSDSSAAFLTPLTTNENVQVTEAMMIPYCNHNNQYQNHSASEPFENVNSTVETSTSSPQSNGDYSSCMEILSSIEFRESDINFNESLDLCQDDLPHQHSSVQEESLSTNSGTLPTSNPVSTISRPASRSIQESNTLDATSSSSSSTWLMFPTPPHNTTLDSGRPTGKTNASDNPVTNQTHEHANGNNSSTSIMFPTLPPGSSSTSSSSTDVLFPTLNSQSLNISRYSRPPRQRPMPDRFPAPLPLMQLRQGNPRHPYPLQCVRRSFLQENENYEFDPHRYYGPRPRSRYSRYNYESNNIASGYSEHSSSDIMYPTFYRQQSYSSVGRMCQAGPGPIRLRPHRPPPPQPPRRIYAPPPSRIYVPPPPHCFYAERPPRRPRVYAPAPIQYAIDENECGQYGHEFDGSSSNEIYSATYDNSSTNEIYPATYDSNRRVHFESAFNCTYFKNC